MQKNKTLIQSLILALSLYTLNADATTYVYRNFIPGVDSSTCNPVKLGSTQVFDYTGGIQEISVPAQAIYAKAFVEGAGGAGGNGGPTAGASTDSGGSGASLYGQISVKAGSSVYVLVGGGGANTGDGSGGGGGLTGIFSGAPSQSTALLVAGGGGGGANSEYPDAYDNGSNGGLQPGKTIAQQLGGMGFGGRGTWSGTGAYGEDGTPFGAGGASTGTYSGPGGFGGGASGGQNWGSGGGGGGMPGGAGGSAKSGTSYGGQGGTSFAASSVQDVHQGSQTAAGGYSTASGQNGSASITFYGCP